MNLQQIYYFKTMAELEHYTHAAEKLLISQPSLSYAMAELERELGAPLFQKRGRGVTLTRYGKVFLEYAETSLQALETGKQKVYEMVNPHAGKIVLSYASSMSFGFLPYMISEFYRVPEHKKIEFVFEHRTTEKSIDKMLQEEVDLVFGSRTDRSDVICHPLYTERMVVIVANDHPLAKRKSVNLFEIQEEELVTWSKGSSAREEMENLYERVGLTPKIGYEVADEIMIIGIVSRGLGIGVIPQMLGTEYRKVTALEIENFEAQRTMYMIWPQNLYRPPVVETFRKFVLQEAEHKQFLNVPVGKEIGG